MVQQGRGLSVMFFYWLGARKKLVAESVVAHIRVTLKHDQNVLLSLGVPCCPRFTHLELPLHLH